MLDGYGNMENRTEVSLVVRFGAVSHIPTALLLRTRRSARSERMLEGV